MLVRVANPGKVLVGWRLKIFFERNSKAGLEGGTVRKTSSENRTFGAVCYGRLHLMLDVRRCVFLLSTSGVLFLLRRRRDCGYFH